MLNQTRTYIRSMMILVSIGAQLGALSGCQTEGEGDESPTPGSAATVSKLTTGGDFSTPLDAVPNAQGSLVYFIAETTQGPGIFSVPASGGAATELFHGGMLADPHGIAISSDDHHLYIADREAGEDGLGGVLWMPADGSSAPAFVPGTESTGAGALTVLLENGVDQLYFTGVTDSRHPLFKIAAELTGEGQAQEVFDGTGLQRPDGVAVNSKGEIFIADQGEGVNTGSLFKLSGSTLSKALDGLSLGDPAGIALTMDGGALLMSAIHSEDGSDQVVIFDTTAGTFSIFNDVVGQNHNSSGGLHRAANANILAWSDKTGGDGKGGVYKVELN